MATQARRLIQDQNFNVHYNVTTPGASVGGKTNVLKAQRKGGLGGRKPLSDLSNSGNPALDQAPKKQTSKNLTVIEENSGAYKIPNDASKRKSLFKTSEKVQSGSRKALSDISNSGKPRLQESSKKNLNMKLSVVAEEPLSPSAIAEEQFLHNHQECIKAQTKPMDLDEFLKTVGLTNDFSKYLASPWAPPESPLEHLELEEMAEQPIQDQPTWKYEMSCELDSPPPCKTPKSPNDCMLKKEFDFINFKLMESP